MKIFKSIQAKVFALSSMLLISSASTFAHSPYLLPNLFDFSDKGTVTLDATMGEYYFVSDRAFVGGEFSVMLPDGSVVEPETQVELQTRTVLEHTLTIDGTYRFSTGWRVGGIVKTYELDGRTRRLRGEDTVIPEGGKLVEITRSSTMAETFVTKGAPTETALMPRGQGLEFSMQSHPNDLFINEAVHLKALVDGNNTAGIELSIYLAERQAESSEGTFSLKSDENGNLMFMPEVAGLYILKSRYSVPSSSEDITQRYTYTMVFEVTE